MTFYDQSRYNRMFQKVVHKGGESEIKYIKIIHNAKDLATSVVNSYTEDQLVRTLLDNFQQGGKYSDYKEKHIAELRREERFIDQKLLSISDLQIDNLN